MKFRSRYAVLEDVLVHCAAERVRVIKLRAFYVVPSALLRALCPIHFPVAAGRLGLDIDDGNAVYKEEYIRANVVFRPFDTKLVRREIVVPVVISSNMVVVNQPNDLRRFGNRKRHCLLVAEPTKPLLIVPFVSQPRYDPLCSLVIRDYRGVQSDKPLLEDRKQQNFPLVYISISATGPVFAGDSLGVFITPSEFCRLEPIENRVLYRAFFIR